MKMRSAKHHPTVWAEVAKQKSPFKLEEKAGSKLVWDQSMIIDLDEGKGADLVVYISQTDQHCV